MPPNRRAEQEIRPGAAVRLCRVESWRRRCRSSARSCAGPVGLGITVPLCAGADGWSATPADMPVDSWLDVSGTHLAAAVPDMNRYPAIRANSGPASVVVAWCGAALDRRRSRLIVWGGGHADYQGNELYAFDVPSLAWLRLTEPFPTPVNDQEINADGTPNSRHTYNGLAYLDHADRLFACGGSLSGIGFARCDATWTYAFATGAWEAHHPSGSPPGGGIGQCCAYDPVAKTVYFGNGKGLFSYACELDTWTQLNSDPFYYMTLAVDPTRRLLIGVGNKTLAVYDLTAGDFKRQQRPAAGAESLVAAGNPGSDYDSRADRLVGWHQGIVYVLDDHAWTWTVKVVAGGPVTSANGTYGRWRYVPSVNAFILVVAWDADVSVFKLTPGGGPAP